MDFCIGTPCYWLIGFGLMFGFNGGSSLSLSTDETMTLSCACGQHPPAEDQGRGHGLQDLGRFRGGGRRDGVDILFSFFLFLIIPNTAQSPAPSHKGAGLWRFLTVPVRRAIFVGRI
ncbi:MAG: hypothetical protein ACLUGP_00765 [Faecalibacterium prausnitzii]